MAHKKQVAQFIGSGYNVFGKYAGAESLKKRIFDINYAESYTRSISINETDCYFVQGNNRKQYQEELTSRVAARAGYPLFPASVEAGFELTGSALDMEENLLTSMNFYRKLEVSTLKDEQEKHIPEDVRKDLEDADPNDVIQRYGGYVVRGVVSGGRWSVNVLSNKLHHESAMKIEGHLKAAAGSYASGEIVAGFKEKVEKEDAHLESRMKVIGGDTTTPSIDKWKTTVTEETAEVIDFTTDGLVPIWDFVNDDERKQQLEEAFERHAEEQMKQLPSEDKLSSILQTKYITSQLPCSSSEGLGAKETLALYSMPDGVGWKYVGHSGNDKVLALKEMRPGYGILKKPNRWLQVWNDSGSYNGKDYSCWIPEPPPGYVALGMFCRFGVGGWLRTKDHKPPSKEEAKNIVVVHESYVEKCDSEETEVWTSKGSGADHTIILGKLKHHALWPTTSTNHSISNTRYTLKTCSTDEVDYTPERPKNPRDHRGKRKLPFDPESPSTPKKRKLQTMYIKHAQPCSSSKGLGANQALPLYDVPDSDGWKYVGHSGDGTVLALKETQPGYSILKKPTGWTKVWSCRKIFTGKHYSCWMPKEPIGYRALGVFCRFGTKQDEPPSEKEVQNFVVVKESHVEKCAIETTESWNSKGSRSKYRLNLGKLRHHALWPYNSDNPYRPLGNIKENGETMWYTLKDLPDS